MIEVFEEKTYDSEANESWISRAACRGLTNVFYSSYNESTKARERRETIAKKNVRQLSSNRTMPRNVDKK